MSKPRRLDIERVYVERTYHGWMIGRPSIKEAIERAETKAAEVFPTLPVLVLPYETHQVPKHPRRPTPTWESLPDWMVIASIVSDRLTEEDDCYGSTLVLIWFTNTFEIVLPESAQDVAWAERARGQYF